MTLPNILSTVRCILSVPHIHVQIQECKDISKDLTILQYISTLVKQSIHE